MTENQDKKYQKIVEETRNLSKLGDYYKEETKNILSGILSKTGWDTAPTSPYETISFVAVPGILEFGGIYKPIKNLIQTGLPVYFEPKLMHFFDKKFIPNLFKEFKEREVLDLFKKSDPKILGLAAEVLKYYHQGRIHLKNNFAIKGSPDGFSGYEYNGMIALSNISTNYKNKPFSKELKRAISKWFKQDNFSEKVKLRQEIELKSLHELSKRVKESFKLGNKL